MPPMRELVEVKYLWKRRVRLKNGELEALIGPEPRTSLDEAVRTTLSTIGRIGEAGRTVPARA